MKYDFKTVVDRMGHDAIAVEPEKGGYTFFAPAKEGFSRIPMWVADMSFPTAPSITRELEERIKHPLYGYFPVSQDYYNYNFPNE